MPLRFGTVDLRRDKDLQDLVHTLNAAVGFRAAEVSEGDVEVLVTFGYAANDIISEGGMTSHYFSAADPTAVEFASIKLVNVAVYQELVTVFLHEAGHVLGLAHDDYESSIMHKPTFPDAVFSDYDKKLLRTRYARKKP